MTYKVKIEQLEQEIYDKDRLKFEIEFESDNLTDLTHGLERAVEQLSDYESLIERRRDRDDFNFKRRRQSWNLELFLLKFDLECSGQLAGPGTPEKP